MYIFISETGQKGARIVEKAENHIKNLQAHGNCNKPSKVALRKKVDELIEIARHGVICETNLVQFG
jgi:hypothetical protein